MMLYHRVQDNHPRKNTGHIKANCILGIDRIVFVLRLSPPPLLCLARAEQLLQIFHKWKARRWLQWFEHEERLVSQCTQGKSDSENKCLS